MQGPKDGAPEVGGSLVWGGAEGRTVGRCLWTECTVEGSGLGGQEEELATPEEWDLWL